MLPLEIERMWRGDYRLLITFWVFFIAIPVPMGIFLAVFASELERMGYGGIIVFLFLAFSIFSLIYYVFFSVAVWRSAKKYEGKRLYADLARIAMVLSWLVWVGSLIAG